MRRPASVIAHAASKHLVTKKAYSGRASSRFDMLELGCPFCKTNVPFVPELAGREVFCLGCGRHFKIPSGAGDGAKWASRPGVELLIVDLADKPGLPEGDSSKEAS